MTRKRAFVMLATAAGIGLAIGFAFAATAEQPPRVTPLTVAPAIPRSIP